MSVYVCLLPLQQRRSLRRSKAFLFSGPNSAVLPARLTPSCLLSRNPYDRLMDIGRIPLFMLHAFTYEKKTV